MTKPTSLPGAGQRVNCPADRGEPAYQGVIRSVGPKVYKNHSGTAYCWISVRHPSGRESVWPSNRLGYRLPEDVVAAGTLSPVQDPVKPEESITRRVPDTAYYATVYRDGSGGYFSTDGMAKTATPLASLEPDVDKRKTAQECLEALFNSPNERPLADPGLISYRYQGRYGPIMIGALDDADALREAARSSSTPVSLDHLDRWVEPEGYVPVNHLRSAQAPNNDDTPSP